LIRTLRKLQMRAVAAALVVLTPLPARIAPAQSALT
jgi:hypothetical protein